MTDVAELAIYPHHIDASKHFYAAFGHCETEESAMELVRFAQERSRGWESFTRADIDTFHRQAFDFNLLTEPGANGCWVVEHDGLMNFTHDFVKRCFNASPVKLACRRCGAVEDGYLFYIPVGTHRLVECGNCGARCNPKTLVAGWE